MLNKNCFKGKKIIRKETRSFHKLLLRLTLKCSTRIKEETVVGEYNFSQTSQDIVVEQRQLQIDLELKNIKYLSFQNNLFFWVHRMI